VLLQEHLQAVFEANQVPLVSEPLGLDMRCLAVLKIKLHGRCTRFVGVGYLVRVQGVDGVVAVIMISGLRQKDDHALVAETVRELVAA
jgi:hypothetical protein